MQVTMASPKRITIQHVDPTDGWMYTLIIEGDNGSSVSILLSDENLQQLWKACENPEVEE